MKDNIISLKIIYTFYVDKNRKQEYNWQVMLILLTRYFIVSEGNKNFILFLGGTIMKKFTAVFTAIFMVMTMVVMSLNVFAVGTDQYVLEEDNSSYLIIEVLNEDDESLSMIYYSLEPQKDVIQSTTRTLYGQEKIKFCIRAKEGMSVKIIQSSTVANDQPDEQKFSQINEMPLGMTDLYEIVVNEEFCDENTFDIEYSINGEKYYSYISFTNYSKEYFAIYAYQEKGSEFLREQVITNKSEDGATIRVECNVSTYMKFISEPYDYDVNYAINVNGYSNTGYQALSEGENYFELEYKGKKYNVIAECTTTTDWSNPFSDVDITDSFFNSVKYCNMNGLMLGTSDTTFTPDSATTRAMVVTTLYRIAGSPKVNGTNNFSDVETGSWYYDAVTWANENGIVLGYENGNFGTNDNITREQFATIMYRYMKLVKPEMEFFYYACPYSESDVSEYALAPMKFAVLCGMIKTTDATNLEPKKEVSRADLAIGLAGFNNVAVPMLDVDGVIHN